MYFHFCIANEYHLFTSEILHRLMLPSMHGVLVLRALASDQLTIKGPLQIQVSSPGRGLFQLQTTNQVHSIRLSGIKLSRYIVQLLELLVFGNCVNTLV